MIHHVAAVVYCPPVITSSPAECTLSPSSRSTASFRAWPSLPAASVLAAGPQRQPESQQRKPAPPSTPVLLLCKTPGYQDGGLEITSQGNTPQPTRHIHLLDPPSQAHPRTVSTIQSALLAFPPCSAPPRRIEQAAEPTRPRHGCDACGARRRRLPSSLFACPTAASTPHLSERPHLIRAGAHGVSSFAPAPEDLQLGIACPMTPPTRPRHGGRGGCFDADGMDGGGGTGRLVRRPSAGPRPTRCCAGDWTDQRRAWRCHGPRRSTCLDGVHCGASPCFRPLCGASPCLEHFRQPRAKPRV